MTTEPNPPKLLDPMRTVLRTKHYSIRTEDACAVLFLYRDVLGDEVPWLENLVRAPRTRRLPTVLTRDEVRRLIAGMSGTPQMIARLLYGTGARLLEVLRLPVKDIDFQTRELTVRNGKGDHDRATMLPIASVRALRDHVAQVRELHDADLGEGFGKRVVAARVGGQIPGRCPNLAIAMGFPLRPA